MSDISGTSAVTFMRRVGDGNRYKVYGRVTTTTASDYLKLPMTTVESVTVGSSAISKNQAVQNSNNGTPGSAVGYVFFDVSGNTDISFEAMGR